MLRKLRNCWRKPPSFSAVETVEYDLSGAAAYNPSADLDPSPRLLQRKNQELENRVKFIEEYLSKRDKSFGEIFKGKL